MTSFWSGRRVLLTGHTGFKGAWLALWLSDLGAQVSGLSLEPETSPNLHDILGLPQRGRFVHADINDRVALSALVEAEKPEIVFHLAAQALVRRSYLAPVETFAANVLGTATLLDVVRDCSQTRAIVVVTSDKAYENRNWPWGYRETDRLGGHDPYGASKACAELVTESMRKSVFGAGGHPARIITARAGNVIGGGDWSLDRLVPDIVRGCLESELGSEGVVLIRNPASVRPWQHVLEPLHAYMLLAERLCTQPDGIDEAWNIGPDASDNRCVSDVAIALIAALGRGRMETVARTEAVHEAHLLTLDCAKARAVLGWKPRLDFACTIALTAAWYSDWWKGADMVACTRQQIARFVEAGA